ncbi:hypothetical protein EHQ53_17715 [Leptospira langatensis]|uniref:Uncharacterized protein n=1 Tax=Leptospira langatensis TaxID=2484983 RepID=A0A5F1ZQP6_9LEPT|nr:hypothetical protein [Leptospira langatensis]TGK05467.1 hypothetical protein EHO57_01955 [Leptospira langatensis]TGL38603.1 hypothetical protein EHQ53_17715 [Leptospira langatensis]
MKNVNKLLLLLLLVTFSVGSISGYFLLKSTKLQDQIEFDKLGIGTVKSGNSLSYLIIKRPKNVFGGHYYYFGARMGKENIPFVQKYSPVLDSEINKFDKIEALDECGQDTYVVTLKLNETDSYIKFNIFDKEPKQVDEKALQSCKRGRG